MSLFIDKYVFAYTIFNHFTSTLEHALVFLKCIVNEHVFIYLVSLSKNPTLTNYETWQSSECFKNQYHMH